MEKSGIVLNVFSIPIIDVICTFYKVANFNKMLDKDNQ